jgi:hypothetical protein
MEEEPIHTLRLPEPASTGIEGRGLIVASRVTEQPEDKE